jgi:hypothetical protein
LAFEFHSIPQARYVVNPVQIQYAWSITKQNRGERMVEQLTGRRFYNIWAIADMLCLDIGEEIDAGGAPVAEFSLHLQCPWRFTSGPEVLMASLDMYAPEDPDAPDAWYNDHAGGAVDDTTLFFARIPSLRERMAGCLVSTAAVSPLGDLAIGFTNGVRFETFTPCSRRGEFWRAIDFRTGAHSVVFDE